MDDGRSGPRYAEALLRINPLAFPTFLIAAALFWIGKSVSGHARSRIARVCLLVFGGSLAIPGFLYVVYYLHFFDHATWFYNFRAIRFTELLAGGMGLLFGIAYTWMEPVTTGEKMILPAVLFIALFIPFMKPVLSPIDLDLLKGECPGDVCLQSTKSSCGPASAATILRNFGMPASERDLAEDAFTYRGGTENWYLARALKDRGLDVHVQSGTVSDPPAPSIAGVLLRGGEGHFIALLSKEGDKVIFVDPLIGKLVLPRDQLIKRYHFTGFFLVVSRRTA